MDSLPPDQRAVLQLILQRGRSYGQIAQLLSIDRDGVRERALSAFDALGPQTGVADQRRALITDYLLGQLPDEAADQTRQRLAASPSERAWARVLASELSPLASEPLPEIPVEAEPTEPPVAAERVAAGEAPDSADPASGGERTGRRMFGRRARRPSEAEAPKEPQTTESPVAAEPPLAHKAPRPAEREPAAPGRERSSSRVGGSVLIVAAVILAVGVVAILLLSGGSKKATPVASSKSSTASTPAASGTGTSSTGSHVLAQINLTSPSSGSKAAGIAEVLKEGASDGIAIVAQNVPPNATKPPNAYAVWLYNSANDAQILGFVNPGVGGNGRLSTAGGLPTNASHYKELIVTLETRSKPKTPGTIVLQGALSGI